MSSFTQNIKMLPKIFLMICCAIYCSQKITLIYLFKTIQHFMNLEMAFINPLLSGNPKRGT